MLNHLTPLQTTVSHLPIRPIGSLLVDRQQGAVRPLLVTQTPATQTLATQTLADLPVSRLQANWLATTVHPAQGEETRSQAGANRRSRPLALDLAWLPRQTAPDWPVLGQLHRLATPVQADEPAAFQVLRRLPTTQAEPARRALAMLPTLGAGEPLTLSIRRPLEALLDRDLTQVRLHTSVVAETLGAEALTTGRHIVFAPGRFDLHSARGVALLGHELAHVGQTLAFKQRPGADLAPMDGAEQQARQQEDAIQQLMTGGWPTASPMQVRRLAQPTPITGLGNDQGEGLHVQHVVPNDGDALPVARLRPAERLPPTVAVGPMESAIDALARQVYGLLKARLRAERDRHQLYRR